MTIWLTTYIDDFTNDARRMRISADQHMSEGRDEEAKTCNIVADALIEATRKMSVRKMELDDQGAPS